MDTLWPVCCILVVAGIIAALVIPKVMQKRAEDENERKKQRERDAAARRQKEYENSVPAAQFTVVHEPGEMLQVILKNLKVEDLREDPPLLETIYFSSVTSDSLVITAGNRTITHWNMTIKAKDDSRSGTSGTITLDRARNKVFKWKANIDDTFFKVRAIVSASDVNGKYDGEKGQPLED